MTYSITDIIEYNNCPARYYLNVSSIDVPDRYKVKTGLYENTPAFVNALMNKDSRDEREFSRMAGQITDGLLHGSAAKDRSDIKKMFEAIELFIERRDLTVIKPGEKIEVNYGEFTISSSYDLVIEDKKDGRRYPTLIDYSNTKYEAQYNPITYRAQVCADYFDLNDKNTVIKIITISNESFWEYNHSRYKGILGVSIEETARMIKLEMYPMRVGWWCAGCHWRGLCHRILTTKTGRR